MPSLVEIGLMVLEKKIFKSCQFNFFYFPIISPLGMEWSFIWTDFVPFSRGYFVPSLVEIGPVVLEKIFKSCQFIFIISQLYPLLEGLGPSFEKTWIPFTQGYFVPSLVEIGPVVLEKKMTMWKVYRQTYIRRMTGDQKSSLELSAQVR